MTELTAEERAARARRAEEVLKDASWAFDELVAQAQRKWLETKDPATREELWQRANAAMGLKGHLMATVTEQQAQEKIDERREQRSA